MALPNRPPEDGTASTVLKSSRSSGLPVLLYTNTAPSSNTPDPVSNIKGLLDYAIKIAAIWVACNNRQSFYTTHPTLCIESVPHPPSVNVEQTLGKKVARNKNPTSSGWNYCSCLQLSVPFFFFATRKLLTKLHSLKAPLGQNGV